MDDSGIPRFGAIAVEKGFITREQLHEGMKEQIDRDLEGLEHRFIGSILYDLGFMTLDQIDEVLAILNRSAG